MLYALMLVSLFTFGQNYSEVTHNNGPSAPVTRKRARNGRTGYEHFSTYQLRSCQNFAGLPVTLDPKNLSPTSLRQLFFKDLRQQGLTLIESSLQKGEELIRALTSGNKNSTRDHFLIESQKFLQALRWNAQWEAVAISAGQSGFWDLNMAQNVSRGLRYPRTRGGLHPLTEEERVQFNAKLSDLYKSARERILNKKRFSHCQNVHTHVCVELTRGPIMGEFKASLVRQSQVAHLDTQWILEHNPWLSNQRQSDISVTGLVQGLRKDFQLDRIQTRRAEINNGSETDLKKLLDYPELLELIILGKKTKRSAMAIAQLRKGFCDKGKT